MSMAHGNFRGGLILDLDDTPLRHRRNGVACDSHEAFSDHPRRLAGEFSYSGFMYHHFGHFMAEMVHRIVPSKLLRPQNPFVFVGRNGATPVSIRSLPRVPRDVLTLLGITDSDCHIITESTIVENLFVVEQASDLGLGPKPGYLEDLHEYVTPRLDDLHGEDKRPEKVYVSRRKMTGGLFLGEGYLEEHLAAEGFTIVYPETLPIPAQMDVYRKAKVLIFVEGSACHGVELLGTLQRCYLLARRGTIQSQFRNILQPRAREFAVSIGHPYIGTKYIRQTDNHPVMRLGVNLFNPDKLVTFFRDNDIARLPLFDRSRYFDAAESDLISYHCRETHTVPHLKQLNGAEALVERFHETTAALFRTS